MPLANSSPSHRKKGGYSDISTSNINPLASSSAKKYKINQKKSEQKQDGTNQGISTKTAAIRTSGGMFKIFTYGGINKPK